MANLLGAIDDESGPLYEPISVSFPQTLRSFTSELESLIHAKQARQEGYRQLFKPEEGFLSFEPDKERSDLLAITRCYKETFLSYGGERIQMSFDDKIIYDEMLGYCFESCVIDVGYFADFQKIKQILTRARRVRIYVPPIIQHTEVTYGTGDNCGTDGSCTPKDIIDFLEAFRESARAGTLQSITFIATFLGRNHQPSQKAFLSYTSDRYFVNELYWETEKLFRNNLRNVERRWFFSEVLFNKLAEHELFFLNLNLRDAEDALNGGKVVMQGPLKEEYDVYVIRKRAEYALLPIHFYSFPRHFPEEVEVLASISDGAA